MSFVRKVLAVLTAQLSLTFFFAMLATASKSMGHFFGSWEAFLVALGAYVGTLVTIVYREEWRKESPKNLALLALGSVSMASLIATFASIINSLGFVTLVMGCVAALAGLLVAAYNTNSRSSLKSNLRLGLYFALAIDLVILLMMCYTMKFDMKAVVVLSSLGMCAITGFYVIFDLTKVIIPELANSGDYILGALCVYLDVTRLCYYSTREASSSQTKS